jgi:hypothetical protein
VSLRGPIVERVLAVLAAVCLVAAFALANLMPITLPLSALLSMIDQPMLLALQDGVRDHVSEWVWQAMFLPVLMRPCWLLPLVLGVVLGGASLTVASRRRASRSPRWRN